MMQIWRMHELTEMYASTQEKLRSLHIEGDDPCLL